MFTSFYIHDLSIFFLHFMRYINNVYYKVNQRYRSVLHLDDHAGKHEDVFNKQNPHNSLCSGGRGSFQKRSKCTPLSSGPLPHRALLIAPVTTPGTESCDGLLTPRSTPTPGTIRAWRGSCVSVPGGVFVNGLTPPLCG